MGGEGASKGFCPQQDIELGRCFSLVSVVLPNWSEVSTVRDHRDHGGLSGEGV